ncbi:hypothetical protein CH379_008940 [Leptospira ellisii]|uniref:Uncharacterized protein n=2 Tax=Leptospira ellisii TaxID=2023197 RepID=A0AAE4QN05_9LEPT|nr:hypothetical protein [Leptospira ellisii]MDV6235750.1 hypothetical protein [Leptospira ellisii]
MTTLLLFMLGLLSAGAGAYTLFREKPASKDSDSSSASGKTGAPGSGSGAGSGGFSREDRGKEIPVSPGAPPVGTPPSPGPGGGGLPGAGAGVPTGDRRGEPKLDSADAKSHKDQFPGLRKKPKLDLKHKVDDIIRTNSKFANHRRPLINAEALVDKESYNGALEIYKRTKTRVPDNEIQGKIQENIDQIENHLESDEEEVYRPENYDGPPIPLGDLVRAIKDISESLGDTISKGFGNPISLPGSPLDPGAIPGPPTSSGSFPSGPVSYHVFSPGPALPPGSIPPIPPGSGSGGDVGPVSFLPSFPGGGGASSGGGGGSSGSGDVGSPSSGSSGGGGFADDDFSGDVGTPSSRGSGGGFSSGGGTSGTGGGSSGGGGPGGGVGSPFGGGMGGGSAGTPSSSDSREYLDPNALDLPEDTFFSEEWDKFKDLPLVDRRTGESRRSGSDRRGQDPNRKDRRRGDDRRKEDLFKLRDDYLKQKEEQKKKERAEAPPEPQQAPEPADFDWPEAPLRDDLPPFLAPVVPKIELVPIRLPDPEDKTVRPEAELPPATTSAPLGELKLETAAPAEGASKETTPLELPKIGLPDPVYQKTDEAVPEIPHLASPASGEEEAPEIEMVEGGLEPFDEEKEESGGGPKEEEPRMIHGILELKPPEVDDAPFLTLTYDFGKIPHAFKLSKNYSIMEYSYYKYKPMLVKAQEFARRKMLKNALNYYRVIKSQNIPPELRKMINRNIKDITEFMEKYLMAKGG